MLLLSVQIQIPPSTAMSSKLALSKPPFLTFPCNGTTCPHKLRCVSGRRRMQSSSSESQATSEEDEVQSISIRKPVRQGGKLKPLDLQFTRLQPSDHELNHRKREFGDFMAREALLEEEYWAAAWLRAESHWEDRKNERYADSYKRKFAEQEFNALRRRCKGHHDRKCLCIVTLQKEDGKAKHTVLKSIVGTLDLSIQCFLPGESFPGESMKAPLFCSIEESGAKKYGYIANLGVAKSARRKGIASNMLSFAIDSAKSEGLQQVFVHTHRENKPAQQLYQKLGFEIVDAASSLLLEEKAYLLLCKI